MATVTILGGTGYAGGHLTEAAARRGHRVISYSRRVPEAPVDTVEYRTGDLTDPAILAAALEGTDVIVSALSPRGDLVGAGVLRGLERTLAAAAVQAGVRLGVVGGAGSLQVAPGGPLLVDTPEFPAEIRPEAQEMSGVLDDLRAAPAELDWFYVSPAGGFGPWAAGELTGVYRIGGDVLLVDAAGDSAISGADFADAVVREIEEPAHRRTRFTVAY